MVGLVRGPTEISCAPVEQDKVGAGGDARADSPSPGRVLSSSLLTWTTRVPAPTILLLPTGHPRAGHRSAQGRDGRQPGTHATHETRGTPKGCDEAPVGELPGLARDGPR